MLPKTWGRRKSLGEGGSRRKAAVRLRTRSARQAAPPVRTAADNRSVGNRSRRSKATTIRRKQRSRHVTVGLYFFVCILLEYVCAFVIHCVELQM